MKKSTHRGFRGPNNFLLARPMFSSRNRTSFFRRRIDRCRCLDRSRAKFALPKERLHGIYCNFPIFPPYCVSEHLFFTFQFHFTSRFPPSPLYGLPLFKGFFLSFALPFLLPFPLSSLSFFLFFSFRFFFPSPSSRDKFECALDTREKLVYLNLEMDRPDGGGGR